MQNPPDMTTLSFITAGTVDDGKSTLIGRLLYDSKSIMADQLEAIGRQSKTRSGAGIDLAMLTDGLRAEREQGITIDVAYRYFATPRRNFRVIDAPGHFQYTRNMITGASHADVMILLVDVRHGIGEQTRRHAAIAALLNMGAVIVAVNKMDLVDYSPDAFQHVVNSFGVLARQLGLNEVQYIPISALQGDNVVVRSASCNWYTGEALLPLLETLETNRRHQPSNSARFPVQYVIRSQTTDALGYRGYAGRVTAGILRKGDAVTVFPSGITTRIRKLFNGNREIETAMTNQSIVLQLEQDIEVGRGDLIAGSENLPQLNSSFDVMLCWMGNSPLAEGDPFLLQQQCRTTRCWVSKISYRLNIQTFEQEKVHTVALNDIARVTLTAATPIAYDPYLQLPAAGTAILVDENSFATVAACMMQ